MDADAPLVPVIEECELHHKFAKSPDHPQKNGLSRCPHCLANGLEECREALAACYEVIEKAESWGEAGIETMDSDTARGYEELKRKGRIQSMNDITSEQVKKAVEDHGIKRWKIRECSICNYPLCYLFEHGEVAFDSGCGCTSRTAISPRSYADVAKLMNMQTPEWREKMWQEFIGAGTADAQK